MTEVVDEDTLHAPGAEVIGEETVTLDYDAANIVVIDFLLNASHLKMAWGHNQSIQRILL